MLELPHHRAYEKISRLPDIVVEYVFLRNTTGESSLASHRKAALAGVQTLASRLFTPPAAEATRAYNGVPIGATILRPGWNGGGRITGRYTTR